MRVMMWCDMEGISAITQWDQVSAGASQYEEGRRLYTADVNAAVRGARKAGASEIIVVDGHGAGASHSFNNWVKEDLEPGAEYVFGHRWSCYVDSLRGGGIDAMLYIGAHAMSGTPDGVLSHTISSLSWYAASLNGTPIGEIGIMAAIAGCFGTPSVYVSGDRAAVSEARALLGANLGATETKVGLGRFCARCLPPCDSRRRIELDVAETLSRRDRWPAPYAPPKGVELAVELTSPEKTADYRNKVGVEITGPRTVVSRAENVWLAWDQFWKG